jgi:tetratricopeptide (TPR) repeat protein
MLGEHGEKEHGILLYRGSLSVPLIVAGPRVPAGAEVREPVGTRALASTLLSLLGAADAAKPFGTALPGVGLAGAASDAIYSETFLPADSYGWSPMRSVTDRRFRYVEAPRPELYDLQADPGESRNLVDTLTEEAKRLRRIVLRAESGAPAASPAVADPELAASLRSLGYLSGSSPRPREGGLDPKDGIPMLAEFEEAKRWLREGRRMDAVEKLETLVRRSPGNVPFLFRLGDAQMGVGLTEEGLRSLSFAVTLSPNLDFLLVRLAQAYAEAGRADEAIRAYRAALRLNPRSAPAWSGLAEIARRLEGPAAERKVLEECESAGTRSASLLARLSDLETALGNAELGRRHAEEAARRAASVRPEAGRAEEDETARPASAPRSRE